MFLGDFFNFHHKFHIRPGFIVVIGNKIGKSNILQTFGKKNSLETSFTQNTLELEGISKHQVQL